MTGDDWQRLKTIFNGALDRPSAERRDWIRRACGDDAELRREVEQLLQAHETAGDFLEQPAVVDSHVDGTLAPGTRIGPYVIREQIGEGGMGIVYAADDQRLGRRVALKALPPLRAGDDVLRERLRREARAAATIAHPAIATVFALEEIDDQLFIASELVSGTTLREEIDRGPIAPERARALAIDIARALAAAHDAGVIHRDLKPENVLVTASGGVKVVDFGIAALQAADATRLTRDGALLGTPAYMAPEQLIGAEVDARADIYAFGMVLGEMLSGEHPLSARLRSSASERDRPRASVGSSSTTSSSDRRDSMSLLLGAVVERCVQIEPSARYADAHALLAELEQRAPVSQAQPAEAAAATTALHARWWWEFHQVATAAAYCLALIPAWRVRPLLGGGIGRGFFVVVLGAAIVAAFLRLHLWFTSRFYPRELKWVRRREGRWIRVADGVFVGALGSCVLIIGEEGAAIALVLVAIAIGAAVAFLIIEPVTARAAFKSSPATRDETGGTHRGA